MKERTNESNNAFIVCFTSIIILVLINISQLTFIANNKSIINFI